MQVVFIAPPRSAHLLVWIMPDADGILGDGHETEAPLGDLGTKRLESDESESDSLTASHSCAVKTARGAKQDAMGYLTIPGA